MSAPTKDTPPAPASGPDPRELAKILAKAAAAKAGVPAGGAPKKAAPAPQPAAPAAPAPLSVAPPPRRAMTAAEALEAARRAEADAQQAAEAKARGDAEARLKVEQAKALARAAAAKAGPPVAAGPAPAATPLRAAEPAVGGRPAPTAVTPLTAAAQSIVAGAWPGVALYVGGTWHAEDRKVLTALWKAHRTRFANAGELGQAASATTVLAALGTTPPRSLAAAHTLADRGDWLVFVDLTHRTVLAAFPDARTLFAGLEGAA